MKNLRKRFELFCMHNRDKGVPNLMLYITLGTAVVYLMSEIAGNSTLYSLLYFNRTLILQGQVWRLFTYPLTYNAGNVLLMAVALLCYYSLGRSMEQMWGTLRFNLYYFTGMILMDVYCLLFGGTASVSYLNLSLFLSYATLFPDSQFLLLFIIPVRAWMFGLFYLVMTAFNVITLSVPVFYFPYNLFPLVSLANYFLFFGSGVLNVLPRSWRIKARQKFGRKGRQPKAKVIQFDASYQQPKTKHASKPDYTHRCTICGRTDVTDPQLEFRYCSRCKGYHCYCEDHISNHTHIQ